MVVTTTEFEPLARSTADSLLIPTARIITVPHPVGGSAPETLHAYADAALDPVMSELDRG